MALYLKKDMTAIDYAWSHESNDNPHKKHLDKFFLNRTEGYEVLDFINQYAEENGLIDKRDARKVELLIHQEVPTHIHNREKIKEWLEKHSDEYELS